MSLSGLDVSILGPAFCAGLLVLLSHVPLGQEVLRRGIIFIDLAVAQIAGLGVIVAASLGWETGGWQIQIIAMLAALTGAFILFECERRWPEIQEALIGCIFVLAACAGILLLAQNPHGGEQLKELLSGQILWVSYSQLLPGLLLTILIVGLWLKQRHRPHPVLFYVLFALAVTNSVQWVGVYLVFASLIMPALAVRRRTRHRLLWGVATGATGYATGLILSALFDWPSGATIVWALAVISSLSAYASRPN